jgi:hypothetical protein
MNTFRLNSINATVTYNEDDEITYFNSVPLEVLPVGYFNNISPRDKYTLRTTLKIDVDAILEFEAWDGSIDFN